MAEPEKQVIPSPPSPTPSELPDLFPSGDSDPLPAPRSGTVAFGPGAAGQPRHRPGDVTLVDAARRIARGWRLLAAITAASVALGALLVAGTQDGYESSARLVPQDLDGMSGLNLGALAQFGSLLGAGNLMSSESALSIQLYPEVVKSVPLQLAVLEKEVWVPSQDTTMRLGDYLRASRPFSFASALSGVFGARAPEETAAQARALDPAIVRVDAEQEALMAELERRVHARFDTRMGVLTISATMPDPAVAAQTADAVVDLTSEFITEYRTQKLKQNLAFIEERHEEARRRYNGALNALASFRDRNRNLALNIVRTEEERLQAEADRTFTLYNSLSVKLEETRIEVQQETPVFKMLQPVSLPLRKSYPSTVLTLLLSLLIGLLAGCGYVYFEPEVRAFRRGLRQPSDPALPSGHNLA